MIKNVPDYADDFPYIVATRECDGTEWFWGVFNDIDKAGKVAKNINGFVVFNPNWKLER